MKLVVAIALVACSAPSQRSTPRPAPAPQRDLAVAEPVPKEPAPPDPLVDPSDPYARGRWFEREMDRQPSPGMTYRRRIGAPQELDVAERDLWSPCLRELVQAQPEHARRALTAAFSRYAVTCDGRQRVLVEPPPEYRGKPFIGYRGAFAHGQFDLALTIASCGATFDRVVIAYDGKQWSSGRQTVETVDGCPATSLPDVRSIRRMLRDVVDARDAVVRIEGAEDLLVTDTMKRDLQLMLDAIDAVSGP